MDPVHLNDPAPLDDFVVVRGGLVDNVPSLPVFDLDVLESDDPEHGHWVTELLELAESIVRHPGAALALREDLLRIQAHVVRHGDHAQRARLRHIWQVAEKTHNSSSGD